MQPRRNGRKTGRFWYRGRRSSQSFIKLSLILTFAIALIFFGHRHRGWRPHHAEDPFPSTISGSFSPIDGDSLWVGGEEVRLRGIDAPEWKQNCRRDGAVWNCGEAARDALVRMIGNDAVTCAISERDVYGRMLGRCAAGGRDLNAGMVATGMAVAFGSYWAEQAKARASRLGLWSGEFQNPSDWRAEQQAERER